MNFKKSITAMGLLCLATSTAMGQTIQGKLTGVKSNQIIIRSGSGNPRNAQSDTISLGSKGKFSYTMKGNTACTATIFPVIKQENETAPKQSSFISVILVPDEQMTLNGSFEKYEISGSDFYKEYQKAKAPLDSINAIRREINAKYLKMGRDEATMNAYREEIKPLMEANKQCIFSYIKAHPDSDVSTALISSLDTPNYEEGVALLTPRAKEGKLSPLYKPLYQAIMQQKEKEQRMNEMEGKPAPTFSLPGLDGNLISLESLRGKYVVLDFWGSWCGWCIKGIPDMKKAYEKHKAHVEFVSIDCRDTEAKWKKAVEANAMPWIQVRCADGCDLPTQYNLMGYPTKVVIDPQGNVVKTIIGESPEFYELLDKLFAK